MTTLEQNDTNNMSNLEELDCSWLDAFDDIEKIYKNYYTEPISLLKLTSIYINNANAIEKISESKIILDTKSILTKEELISAIKHSCYSNNIKYKLSSALLYNIDLEPNELKHLLKSTNDTIGDKYLTIMKNIDESKLNNSISMFHDINEIILIFYIPRDRHNNNNITRKTCKMSSNKCTKRNRLKDKCT